MAKTVYVCTGISGGGSNLDGLDGANLSKGDMAFIYFSTDSIRKHSVYWLTTQAAAQSLPGCVVPDSNPGSFCWKKIKKFSTST